MAKKFFEDFKKAEALEKSREATYKKYANKVSFPAGKEVLKFLAKAEKRHLKILEEQKNLLSKGESVDLSGIEALQFTPSFAKKSVIKDIESDISILKEAAKLEKEDVKFYRELMAKAKRSDSKKLFNKLLIMERSHLIIINKTILSAHKEGIALKSWNPKVLFSRMIKRQ